MSVIALVRHNRRAGRLGPSGAYRAETAGRGREISRQGGPGRLASPALGPSDVRVPGADPQSIAKELGDIGLIDDLNNRLREELGRLNGAKVRGRTAVAGGVRALHAELLWLLARGRQPDIIVETGACNGLSSAVLLEALASNRTGSLFSVDLPEFTDPAQNTFDVWEGKVSAAIPAGRDVG